MKRFIPTIEEQLDEIRNGRETALSLVDEIIARAGTGAGSNVYIRLFEKTARGEARAADELRRAGAQTGPLGGIPITVKDLFDVRGEVTTAGSRLLSDNQPASEDAEVVRRIRAAGAVITGHTNMTEFAYSGVGLNPHYGTPPNPVDNERIPGGSSSGSAVAVAQGLATAAIGTDTGGSVRIPAAFCGLVGFKPTLDRVPRNGVFPLSPTLDSVGPIAASVECCAIIDSVLAGYRYRQLSPMSARGLRVVVPTTQYITDGMDESVSEAFDNALHTLEAGGASIDEAPFEVFERLPELGAGGGFTAAESYHVHRRWIESREDEYDPRVSVRIKRGKAIGAAEYLELHRIRQELMVAADRLLADWDVLVMPTVPIVPPVREELESDQNYQRFNGLILRNPTVVNMLGMCAISIPCHRPGELPIGLMLVGRARADNALLRIAAGMESLSFYS